MSLNNYLINMRLNKKSEYDAEYKNKYVAE